MGVKLNPKLGVSVKPLNKWGVKEALTSVGAVDPLSGILTKTALDKLPGGLTGKRAPSGPAPVDQAAIDYVTERNESRDMLKGVAGQAVPGVAAAAVDPAFRNAQLQLLQQLTQRSQGQGPSLAQQQFQQAGNTALQKSMGAIRAATGTNAALGGRTAALASTNLLGNIAAESGMARLREQQDAQKMLGDLAGAGRLGDLQGRQQDINLGTSNAELALKNASVRAAAAGELLGDTRARFEGDLTRRATVKAAKASGKGGGGSSDLLGGLLGAAGTVVGSIYGGPVGGAAGGAAGGAIGRAAGGAMSLTGTPSPEETPKPIKPKTSPFMRIRR